VHPLTWLFLAAVLGSAALELWLAARQARHLRRHAEAVPPAFERVVTPAAHRRAVDYALARLRVARVGTVWEALLVLGWTLGGGIAVADRLWRAAGLEGAALGAAVIVTVVLAHTALGLPLAAWRTFGVEARFGYNRATPALFAADAVRGGLLLVAIGWPLAWVLVRLMNAAGPLWWLWAWGVWVAFGALMAWAWPALIAPLFNRFTPLEDEVLRRRIEGLLERSGFRSRGVYVMDGSRRSTHGNAWFAGLGRSRRIVLYDTLLERLVPGEVEAVLAHELGHYRHGHVRRRLLRSALAALAGFALLGWLAGTPWFHAALGVPEPSPHAALLLFAFAVPPFLTPLTPLAAWFSRRDELEADAFAARAADAGALAHALVKLYRDNGTPLTTDPLWSAFHDSHPPPQARIARLAGPDAGPSPAVATTGLRG